MRVLVVDDEAPARARLVRLLGELDGEWQVAGEAANGAEAVAACCREPVDIVLMDIRMPQLDGLAAAQQLGGLDQPPAVIFTTAYDEHALAAFEAQAVDYLLKPIRAQRLAKALARARQLSPAQLEALAPAQPEPQWLSASYRGGILRIALQGIVYLRADHKYVVARHADGEALLEESLKQLEERFPGQFLRIHRNALVNPQAVQGLEKASDGRTLMRLAGVDERLEVSRRHLAAVKRWLRGQAADQSS